MATGTSPAATTALVDRRQYQNNDATSSSDNASSADNASASAAPWRFDAQPAELAVRVEPASPTQAVDVVAHCSSS